MLNFSQWQARINEVFSTAKLMHSSSLELNERLDRFVRNEVNRKSPSGRAVYNNFEKGFVTGQIHLHFEIIYKDLEFCYLVHEVIYTTDKNSDKPKVDYFYDGENVGKLKDAPCGHYWKGTDKKFF